MKKLLIMTCILCLSYTVHIRARKKQIKLQKYHHLFIPVFMHIHQFSIKGFYEATGFDNMQLTKNVFIHS